MNTRVFTTVRVEIRPQGDALIAVSHDVPGLHVWGADEKQVCDRAMAAIKVLFKHNRGLDVEVSPATDVATFPELPAFGCNSFAIAERARAAA